MELSEIDRAYALYNKRYNLERMAELNGLTEKNFKDLPSKDKFLLLSAKLREINKINLASFFYGKLFEISNDFTALLYRIDCLMDLNEYEEALKYNNIAYELYLEDETCTPEEIVPILNYQKCQLCFYMNKFNYAQWFCEENIIDNPQKKEFFYLLYAIYIATGNLKSANRLYVKYGNKFGDSNEFITECLIHLLKIDMFDQGITFISNYCNIDKTELQKICKNLNGYSPINKNRTIIKDILVKGQK